MVRIIKLLLFVLLLSFVSLTNLEAYQKSYDTSFDYYNLALEHLRNNQFKKAEKELIMAIELSDKKSAFLYEELAHCQVALSKFKLAETNYKKAIDLEKNNIDYYQNLEHLYFSEKKHGEAKDVLRKILTIESNNEDALYDMASLLLNSKKYNQAINYYKKLLTYYPENPESLISLVRVYSVQKEYHQALQIIHTYSNALNNNVVLQLEKAYCLKQLGEYENALSILESVNGEEKHNPIVLQEKSENYYLSDKLEKAISSLTQLSNTQQFSFFYSTILESLTSTNQPAVLKKWNYILSVDPMNLIAYYGSAKNFEKMQDFTNAELAYVMAGKVAYSVSNLSLAEKCFKKAKTLTPSNLTLSLLLAYLFEAKNRKDEAISEIQNALVSNQSSFTLHFYLAELYDKLNRKSLAFKEYNEAYNCDTNRVEPLVKLGYLASELNKEKQSLRYFKKAYTKKTNDANLLFVLGLSYISLQDYEKGIQALQKYKTFSTNISKVYYYLGLSYYQMNDIDSAISNLNLAVEKNSNDIESCNFLGYLLADKNKNLDRAMKLIKKSLDAEPHNPSYLDSLGWVLYRMKHYQKALDILKIARTNFEKKNINESIVYEHLGDVYYTLKKYSKAYLYFKKSYNLDLSNKKVKKKLLQAKKKL